MNGSPWDEYETSTTKPRLLFASACLCGALGQAVAAMTVNVPLPEALVARTIPNLIMPMPIDYAAGSLVGISMGLGWAKSFLHHEETEERPRADARRRSSSMGC